MTTQAEKCHHAVWEPRPGGQPMVDPAHHETPWSQQNLSDAVKMLQEARVDITVMVLEHPPEGNENGQPEG